MRDSWTVGAGTNQRTYTLTSTIPRDRPIASPFITDEEITKTVTVSYATPIIDPFNPANPVLTEAASLTSWSPPSGTITATNYGPLDVGLVIPGPAQKRIEVGGYVYSGSSGSPFEPIDPDPIIIKTYPLGFFDEIRITGLISEPILLRSYYAQAAMPAHHNWGAWYVFEPRLDPDVPPRQLDELSAANIRLLYVSTPPPWGGTPTVEILGWDGQFRPW
jgi:hypothetical protein